MKPEVWMIQIRDNPVSMYYRGRVEESWKDYDLKFYDAVTPKDFENENFNHFLNFGKKRDTIDFSLTEKAVWYSHVNLWVKARRKPILIIEHDALLVEPIDSDWFENDMVCFGHTGKRKALLPGLAYYLTPDLAKRMVNDVKNISKITWNSDGTINEYCRKYGAIESSHVMQVNNRSLGTTIEHPKS